jgi:hypothetical protein
MTEQDGKTEFLVLSRGKWDTSKSREEVQRAIDAFYAWYERCVADGRMKPGRRLATAGKTVSPSGVTDGPFAETKELVGGYWFIVARTLDEAAALAAENPCISCGLSLEVRPVELERASAFSVTNETPTGASGRQWR